MERFFTHYWKNNTLRYNPPGNFLGHTAGNLLLRPGIEEGDRIFVISLEKRITHFVGALTASEGPITYKRAKPLLGDHIWDSEGHIIAKPGTASIVSHTNTIPIQDLNRLRFLTDNSEAQLKFREDGTPDPQSLRGVREITEASAAILESLIENHPAPYKDELF